MYTFLTNKEGFKVIVSNNIKERFKKWYNIMMS